MKLLNHLTTKEILRKYKSQKSFNQFVNWQIIYSVQKNPGKSCEEISVVLGIAKWKIFRIVECYNKEGKTWQGEKKRGGRRESISYLTIEGERKLLNKISQDALKGLVLTYHDIKREIEDKLNKTVSDDYIWDLFKRHGWKKKSPRPKHPLQDKEAGEEFKKNLKKIWQPPQ